VAKNLAFGRKTARDMVPGGRLAVAFRNYGMRTLKYHPRKEQVIEKVLAPCTRRPPPLPSSPV